MEVGSYEAKAKLAALLERARKGETITITRHGVPVARLVPAGPPAIDVPGVVAAFDALRRTVRPGPPSIREMIETGRRY